MKIKCRARIGDFEIEVFGTSRAQTSWKLFVKKAPKWSEWAACDSFHCDTTIGTHFFLCVFVKVVLLVGLMIFFFLLLDMSAEVQVDKVELIMNLNVLFLMLIYGAAFLVHVMTRLFFFALWARWEGWERLWANRFLNTIIFHEILINENIEKLGKLRALREVMVHFSDKLTVYGQILQFFLFRCK